ncbi:major facilitator superfamily domain-containing protein [Aspergillus egyptiacus]|nr:major facilitator superfamily domain-containing protein [Aspergillus egyptiacus]
MQSTKGRPPWLLQYRSSTVFIVATVWISSFTDYFLYAMIVPILPTALVERANVPYKDREYWVSVLLMSEAATAFICCPIFGYIVDTAPTRRLPYVLGLIFLGASMGLLAAARSTAMFVFARLLQGGATAMVAVAGLALLTDSVPLDNLGQTIGYQGSAVALGFLLGPLLGGIVYDAAGYQVVMGMAFVLVALDLAMRVAVVEKKVARSWAEDPVEVSVPVSSSSSTTVRPDGYRTFASPRVAVSNADASASADTDTETGPRSRSRSMITSTNNADYSAAQHRHHKPTFIQIAKQPRVVISSFGLLVQGLLYSAFDATIPIFVETTFHWTPLGAGLAFLPSALTALFEPFFGYISDKTGTRPVTFTSFLLLPFPLISLSLVKTNTPAQISLLLSLLTVLGLLMNLATPALFVETQDVLDRLHSSSPHSSHPPSDRTQNPDNNDDDDGGGGGGDDVQSGKPGVAQAFGIQTMAQFLGMFLGSLWGGFVEWRFGWAVMVFSLAGLCLFTAGWMVFLGPREKKQGEWSLFRFTGYRKGGKGNGREVENGNGDGERERLLDPDGL